MFSFFRTGIGLIWLLCANVALAQSPLTLHKNPWCTCCEAYAQYLEAHGFSVNRVDHQDMMPIKLQLSTAAASSCHTIELGQHVIEGHVPVKAIWQLLQDATPVYGLTVPGMPLNSPGMGPETPGSLPVYSLSPQGDILGLYGYF